MSDIRTGVSISDTGDGAGVTRLPTVPVMASTMLTKRRVVDHCHVRSSLCRMS
jgi:hypothetical protein